MIVPDTNLLVYAYDSTSPQHDAARRWWEKALSETTPVGIPWIVILAFTRLMTHPTVSTNPMGVGQVREVVAAWLEREQVRILSPTLNTFHLFFDLLEEADTGGNLSTDAMIASIALEHGGRVLSNDNDFSRFSALVWHNPIASKG